MTRKVLVTGASGLLGRQVLRVFDLDGWKATGTALSRINPPEVIKLDLLDTQEINRVVEKLKPDAIIHCAANRFPDSCEKDPQAARKVNVDATRSLTQAALQHKAFFIYISTDYVFPGTPGEAPYTPTSTPSPPNVYGQTKLDGEKAVLEMASQNNARNKVVVLRVPVLYGSCDDPSESAVNVLLSQLWASQDVAMGKDGEKIKVDNWAQRYPTNTKDVGRVCLDICKLYLDPSNSEKELPSILHFSSEDKMTKWEIVQVLADIMGLPLDGMEPSVPDNSDGVKRPFDCHLDSGYLKNLGIDVSTVDFRTWWRYEVRAFRH